MKISENKGFTLVELMIVVVILGIITAIAIPVYRSIHQKAEKVSCLQNQRIIHSAAEEYKNNNGSYPDSVQILVDEDYLQAVPRCLGLNYGEIDSEGFARCPKNNEKHTKP